MNRSSVFPPIPAETAQAAQSAVARYSPYHVLADAMNGLFSVCLATASENADIGDPVLFLRRAVIVLLQEVELLTDRQAATASHARLDWVYALHLPLNHSEFAVYEFCLFRQMLFSDPAAGALFAEIRRRVSELDLWPEQRSGAGLHTQSVSQVCRLNQSSWFAEALEQALEELAAAHPEVLSRVALPHWFTQYLASRRDDAILVNSRDGSSAGEEIRKDIAHLLKSLESCDDQAPARIPEVRRLRRTWRLHCDLCDRQDRLCVVCTHCVVGGSIGEGHY